MNELLVAEQHVPGEHHSLNREAQMSRLSLSLAHLRCASC